MAFKMRGMSFVQGQSPMKKIGGKNYEKSKGDQQGPIPKNNIKLQPSENPDTYAYKEGDINPYYLKDKTKFVEGQRINDLEDRKSFIEEDEFNSGESTKQQTKDKKTLEREAEIMRDRRKNTPAKKHVKGMKHKSKEQLLKEGFTPADADRMIKDGATTGKQQTSKIGKKIIKAKKSTKSAHGQMNDAKEEYKQDKKILKKQAKDLKPKNQGKFKPAYEGADYSKKDIAKMSKKEKIAKIDGYTSKKTKK
tara:strand:+ start:3852 stop:4601 length:750 start_codon:yes stop_codon:yes gene_type:complete